MRRTDGEAAEEAPEHAAGAAAGQLCGGEGWGTRGAHNRQDEAQ